MLLMVGLLWPTGERHDQHKITKHDGENRCAGSGQAPRPRLAAKTSSLAPMYTHILCIPAHVHTCMCTPTLVCTDTLCIPMLTWPRCSFPPEHLPRVQMQRCLSGQGAERRIGRITVLRPNTEEMVRRGQKINGNNDGENREEKTKLVGRW